MKPTTINSAKIKAKAFELGITKIGIVQAQTLEKEGLLLKEWLSLGYQAKMAYMERTAEKRINPSLFMPEAESVISVAINYFTPHQHQNSSEVGKISRYAWGDDYHDLLGKKLELLAGWLKEQEPGVEAKFSVDAGPMMDKAWAVKAGIGWLGKHTNVISRDYGSWLFLGQILTNLELEYEQQTVPDFCGSCTRCIDACPTEAIVAPYLVDSRKCISYVTIELKDSSIPQEVRPNLKNWIFGCDICQDVCPWNKFSKETTEDSFQPYPENLSPNLKELQSELSQMSNEEFKKKYASSPISRPKLAGLLRNVNAVIEKELGD
ncbi:MAG: tRNA epoxyqueuosine(34) reductase QueG [Blastocatellia bacterium]|nr:tRNA epoxyqueuosine(34) reductase QueG [Blastocatellia bacterium]